MKRAAIHSEDEQLEFLKMLAALQFCRLVKELPETEVNKRIAIEWVEAFCNAHDLWIMLPFDLDKLATAVDESVDLSVEELHRAVHVLLFSTLPLNVDPAAFLRKYSRRVDGTQRIHDKP